MDNSFYNFSADPILISDPLITQIPLQESNEELVDLGDVSLFKIDSRLADKKGHHRLVRRGLAQRLCKAADLLPKDICFLIIEGFRPLELQKQYFEQYFTDLSKIHPNATQQQLYILTSRYVSPPDQLPPHCSGAAIDLSLAYKDGPELDMGTPVNASPEQSNNNCYTNSVNISHQAHLNRNLLCTTLEAVGLVNYPTEWWHWSYGDRYWSYKTKSQVAIYGAVKDL